MRVIPCCSRAMISRRPTYKRWLTNASFTHTATPPPALNSPPSVPGSSQKNTPTAKENRNDIPIAPKVILGWPMDGFPLHQSFYPLHVTIIAHIMLHETTNYGDVHENKYVS